MYAWPFLMKAATEMKARAKPRIVVDGMVAKRNFSNSVKAVRRGLRACAVTPFEAALLRPQCVELNQIVRVDVHLKESFVGLKAAVNQPRFTAAFRNARWLSMSQFH